MDYTPPVDVSPAYTLESLQAIDTQSDLVEKDNGISRLRQEAIIETALEVGAQGGLAARSLEINSFLDATHDALDQQFPFYPLLIDGEIVPPVILESRQAISTSNDGKTLRLADATYKIKRDAEFVSAAPTWRDYLVMESGGVTLPHRTIAPETAQEKQLWSQYVLTGWKSGVEQANQIYELALNELKQDYVGMVTYRKLLAEGKVSKPKIERNNLGVTGNGREMAIGDRVRQITLDSSLQVNNSDQWVAPVLPDDKPVIRSNTANVKSIDAIKREVEKTNPAIGREHVRAFLNRWIADWESGDVGAYLRHYGQHFSLPNAMTRSEWEASRRASISRTSYIDVSLSDLAVTLSDDRSHASVRFEQGYKFGRSRGHVSKIMLLDLNAQGEWEIVYEAELGPRQSN